MINSSNGSILNADPSIPGIHDLKNFQNLKNEPC